MRSRALHGTDVYWPLRDERAHQGGEKQVCWRDTESKVGRGHLASLAMLVGQACMATGIWTLL